MSWVKHNHHHNNRREGEGVCVGGGGGRGVVQLVERRTEKPGAILTLVRVPGAAKDPRVNFRCTLSAYYVVRTAPVCDRTLQIPNTGSHTIL